MPPLTPVSPLGSGGFGGFLEAATSFSGLVILSPSDLIPSAIRRQPPLHPVIGSPTSTSQQVPAGPSKTDLNQQPPCHYHLKQPGGPRLVLFASARSTSPPTPTACLLHINSHDTPALFLICLNRLPPSVNPEIASYKLQSAIHSASYLSS